MSLSFLGTLILTACLQTSVDRNRAENLARAGRTVEAFELFKQIVDASPSDVEARVWLGRLALRLGRTDEADKWFRSVLRDHPADVEARIGLGTVLTRTGHWRDALRVLTEVERQAGQNADLLGALARAYRRGGDDQRALEYFERARALSPNDPDLVSGYEAVARTYSHRIAIDGFSQTGAPGANAGSGTIVGDVRTAEARAAYG